MSIFPGALNDFSIKLPFLGADAHVTTPDVVNVKSIQGQDGSFNDGFTGSSWNLIMLAQLWWAACMTDAGEFDAPFIMRGSNTFSEF